MENLNVVILINMLILSVEIIIIIIGFIFGIYVLYIVFNNKWKIKGLFKIISFLNDTDMIKERMDEKIKELNKHVNIPVSGEGSLSEIALLKKIKKLF